MQRPNFPGVSAWVVFSASIVLLFLLLQFVPVFDSFIVEIAALMPAPFAGSVLFTLLLFSGIFAVLVKILAASRKRKAVAGVI